MFIIDDIINAVGASQAAAAQERSIKEAMGLQREMWTQQRADQAPYMAAGQGGLTRLQDLLNNPSSFSGDASYQFRLGEGQKALERSAAARGGLNSGGFMKGLSRYSQGLASEEYGNQYNRLSQLAGMGLGSAQNIAAHGGNYANNMSGLYGDQGNAQAAGITGITNGAAGAVRSLGNIAMQGLGGGFSKLGIPGLGGGGGGGGPMMNTGASMGSGYIPRQVNFGLNYGG